jgi:hypothetical protein
MSRTGQGKRCGGSIRSEMMLDGGSGRKAALHQRLTRHNNLKRILAMAAVLAWFKDFLDLLLTFCREEGILLPKGRQ